LPAIRLGFDEYEEKEVRDKETRRGLRPKAEESYPEGSLIQRFYFLPSWVERSGLGFLEWSMEE
jgi:hypothetical protein